MELILDGTNDRENIPSHDLALLVLFIMSHWAYLTIQKPIVHFFTRITPSSGLRHVKFYAKFAASHCIVFIKRAHDQFFYIILKFFITTAQ